MERLLIRFDSRLSFVLIAFSALIFTPSYVNGGRLNPFMPTKEEVRVIQKEAYICSLVNKALPCQKTRKLLRPLLDNQAISTHCKDILWDLLQVANHSEVNDFLRRDSIDQPARKLLTVCVKPKKLSSPKKFYKTTLRITET